MKIIDNKKDFYDWVAGVDGIDSTIVFDRRGSNVLCNDYDFVRNFSKNMPVPEWGAPVRHAPRRVYIHDEYTHGTPLTYQGACYTVWISIGRICYVFLVDRYREDGMRRGTERLLTTFERPASEYITRIDWMEACDYDPKTTYMKSEFFNSQQRRRKCILNPIFKDTWISGTIDSIEAFRDIYSYIASMKDPDIPDNRTNKEKIVSGGFDPVTSFRNM